MRCTYFCFVEAWTKYWGCLYIEVQIQGRGIASKRCHLRSAWYSKSFQMYGIRNRFHGNLANLLGLGPRISHFPIEAIPILYLKRGSMYSPVYMTSHAVMPSSEPRYTYWIIGMSILQFPAKSHIRRAQPIRLHQLLN